MATQKPLSSEVIEQLFTKARSQNGWLDQPVSDQQIHDLYDLMKWGPTSANSSPARIVFVRTSDAKERLLRCVAPGNIEKTQSAPVTAIIASDSAFYEQLHRLFPHFDLKPMFEANAALAQETAFRSTVLQGAYLMMAARTLGLDVGPLSGFDAKAIDEEFFKGTPWKSNFLCNIGYGDPSKVFPRLPRLAFNEAAKIL